MIWKLTTEHHELQTINNNLKLKFNAEISRTEIYCILNFLRPTELLQIFRPLTLVP